MNQKLRILKIYKCCIIFCIFCISIILAGAIVSSEPASLSKDTPDNLSTNFEWNRDIAESYPIPKQIRYTLSIQNLENKPGKEEVKLWIYAPSKRTSHQVLKMLKTSYPSKVSEDNQGNVICEFSIPEIAPYETKIFRLWADLGMSETPQQIIPMNDLERYMKPERLIESDNPKIREKALKFKKATHYETAKSMYQWVADTIKGNMLLTEDKGALYALENLEGDCTESATLFVAMCRAVEIPARMVCGYICQRNCIVTAIDFHNWAEFYHEGRWHLADPQNRRFDQNGEDYIAIEIYTGEHKNPIGNYHRYRFEGEGVRFKVKMTQ